MAYQYSCGRSFSYTTITSAPNGGFCGHQGEIENITRVRFDCQSPNVKIDKKNACTYRNLNIQHLML